MFKSIKEFLLTLFIPLIYGFNLFLIFSDFYGYQEFPPPTKPLLPLPLLLLSLFLALFGLTLWFTSYLYLKTNFSILPAAKNLITAGPYRFFSHPIYLGISLTMVGLSLVTYSLRALFFALIITIPLSICRAHHEEKLLKKKFGPRYQAHLKSTLL